MAFRRNYNTIQDDLEDNDQNQRPNELFRERPAPAILTSGPRKLCIMGVAVFSVIFVSCIISIVILESSDDDSQSFNGHPQYFTDIEVKSVLSQFQSIANANKGSRSVQTGYNDSATYISASLSNSGWKIELQPFSVRTWELIGSPLLQDQTRNLSFVHGQSFNTLVYSGNGNIVLPIQEISNFGCSDDDYPLMTEQSIALVKDGSCTPSQKATTASKLGFSGLVIWKDKTAANLVVDGLDSESSIPVVVVSYSVGSYLSFYSLDSANPSTFVLRVVTALTETITNNVIATWPHGNQATSVVVGAQLDSPTNSAGINNNGLGAAILFEYALTFSQMDLSVQNQPILCWWSASELGNSGSSYFVNSKVSDSTIDQIAMYINLNIIGSPNPLIQVYNTSVLPASIQQPSSVIANEMSTQFEISNGDQQFHDFTAYSWQKEFTSDWNAFANAPKPVPVGGYFTGANRVMTTQERELVGDGIVNAPYDPCFQQTCDVYGNFDDQTISQISSAVVGSLNTFIEEKDLIDLLYQK